MTDTEYAIMKRIVELLESLEGELIEANAYLNKLTGLNEPPSTTSN